MKLGIIGLPQSGKSTVFEALTNSFASYNKHFEDRQSVVRVTDNRLDILSDMYYPHKTIHTSVEYFLPGKAKNIQKSLDENSWNQIRDCDALIHVVKNFNNYQAGESHISSYFNSVNQDLILSDTMIIEKRLDRLTLDKKKEKNNAEELSLLEQCLNLLEKEKPIRFYPEIATSKILRGYAFLSAKPMLILVNNNDDDDKIPENSIAKKDRLIVIRAKLEQELGQMTKADSMAFLNEFNISSSAADQVINTSYEILGLISFFTVGKDEVRAWAVKSNTTALDAAEVIHSDIKKGFIRAELVSYNDLIKAGTYSEARKRGAVRLEGKTYTVRDGDIINFRFNI